VTVEIEDQYLKSNQGSGANGANGQDNKRYPSAKQIEFEIDLDPNWNLS
jgi:hypothetical protein